MDRKLTLNVKRETVELPQNQTSVRHTYGFGDAHMVKYYNMDTQTDGKGIGNYSRIDYAMRRKSDGKTQIGGRQAPLVLGLDEMRFVEAIQPNDYSLSSKMNWFGKDLPIGEGRPCWKVGNSHYCDSIVYGHSMVSVRLDTLQEFVYEFPTDERLEAEQGGNIIEKATFYKLNHFTREMMDMTLGAFKSFDYEFTANGKTIIIKTSVRENVIPLITSGLVQVVTQADVARDNPNRINCTERGIKLFPLWSPYQYALYTGYDWYIWSRAVHN